VIEVASFVIRLGGAYTSTSRTVMFSASHSNMRSDTVRCDVSARGLYGLGG
jgi:hypothetical protein